MAVASSTRFLLRSTDPSGTAAELDLAPGVTILGRALDCAVVLADPRASRHHARITVSDDGVAIEDLGSRNGTLLNGERITAAGLSPGDSIRIGGSTLELVARGAAGDETQIATSAEGVTMIVPSPLRDQPAVLEPVARPNPAPAQVRGIVSDEILAQPIISEQQLIANGVDVLYAECAALGGGHGSFMWVDYLRNQGVGVNDILVVASEEKPYARYQRLCLNSQIPPHERLRSGSDSCPDNLWGFPSYGQREVWRELKRANLRLAGSIMWKLFNEPAFSETFTPRSGDVFSSMDREAERIGWSYMLRYGRLRALRKSAEGNLVAIASVSDETQRRHYAVASRFVHVALGYPAIQLLPDLAEYRERTGDRDHVVAAYEPHAHIYEQLRERGGTVVLRGRGIVASRIIQRLWEERRNNKNIFVVHLHRSRLTDGHRYGLSKRQVVTEWEFQPFNWPKGAWTGEHRATLESASNEERKNLLEVWGGTTTADRRDWKRMVQEGLREGWYRPEYGTVKDVQLTPEGRIATRIANTLAGGGTLDLTADFVIDCTGLVASPDRAPVLGDMIRTYGLQKNLLGRLQVTNDFEVPGMRHGASRMFAIGATTLGGPGAAVDSFLGLQYASLRAANAMLDAPARGQRQLNGLYSWSQWRKWRKGIAP